MANVMTSLIRISNYQDPFAEKPPFNKSAKLNSYWEALVIVCMNLHAYGLRIEKRPA